MIDGSAVFAITDRPPGSGLPAGAAQVTLADGASFAGGLAPRDVTLADGQTVIRFPGAQILWMQRPADDSRSFRLRAWGRGVDPASAAGRGSPLARLHPEMWGFAEAYATLPEPTIDTILLGVPTEIPTDSLVSLNAPQPELPAALAAAVTRLIGRMGDDRWEIREAASRNLASLGPLARPALESAVQTAADEEVRMRARELLTKLTDKND